jgi:hypothetical protein
MSSGEAMIRTTLRIEDETADFLTEAAKADGMSINAYLERLIRRDMDETRRHRLAQDWAHYAQDPQAQNVEYAFKAQASVVAEPKARKATKPRRS